MPNHHILTQNLYDDSYDPKPKYLIIGYLDPLAKLQVNRMVSFRASGVVPRRVQHSDVPHHPGSAKALERESGCILAYIPDATNKKACLRMPVSMDILHGTMSLMQTSISTRNPKP